MNHPSKAAVLAGCTDSCCHPSEAAYAAGCKCDPCMRRRMRVRKRHHIRAAQGAVMVQVDTEPLEQWVAEGFGVDLLSAVLGVSDNTITGLMAGGRTDREKAARVRALTRQEILALAPDRCHVPTVGARRRVHALMRIGWPHLDIAGGNRSTMRLIQAVCAAEGRYVLAGTHRLISSRFDALGMDVGPSAIVRRIAERRGYPPPLAWDEDEIDDPEGLPRFDGNDDLHLRHQLYRQGVSDSEMARELGVSRDAIRVWRVRHDLPSNYAPRGRTA